MDFSLFLANGLIVVGTLYFLLATVLVLRRSWQQGLTRSFLVYLFLSGVWEWLQALGQQPWANDLDLVALTPSRLALYGGLLLSAFFIIVTQAFLRLEGRTLSWLVAGLWLGVALLLDFNAFAIDEVMFSGPGWMVPRDAFTYFLLVVGWSVLLGTAVWQTFQAARRISQPLHLNRLMYWTVVLGLTVVGDGLRFSGHIALGSLLRLVATFVATYTYLTHQLMDMRRMLRRGLSYFTAALLTVSAFLLVFVVINIQAPGLPDANLWIIGAMVTLALALLFNPVVRLLERTLNRAFASTGYNPSELLREYSLTISQILDLEQLGAVSVNVLREELGARDGILFVVDSPKAGLGRPYFELRDVSVPLSPPNPEGEGGPPGGVPSGGTAPLGAPTNGATPTAGSAATALQPTTPAPVVQVSRSGQLATESPIASFLKNEKRPLMQYDIDLLARFRDTQTDERRWLVGLSMDVYVPIHAKDEWIGLLALGPKVSRDRYFEDDLVWLSTMADQTAVALQNARLVDDLVKVNADLKKAYSDLEGANRELQELDRLKSNFIGVITHELRTPFSKIAFSLQLLEKYGLENLIPEQREQLEQLRNNLQEARVMVDNLINFSAFLSKQGKLNLSEVNFGQLVNETTETMRFMANRRNLELVLKVPEELPMVFGDRERMAEAVQHLVHNAIKFTEKGKVTVSVWATEKNITFEVKDTGVGIPKEKLSSLWKDFSQMADPMKRGVEGLGLGLALVKYVVSSHGGEVWVHSMPKYGSTFGFYIPLPPEEEEEKEGEAAGGKK